MKALHLKRRQICLAVFSSLLCVAATAQSSPPFPSRPITLVVPFTPGSGSDTIARVVGPHLAAKWGQAVVVDNKPGASGTLVSGGLKARPNGF